jgi:hypothetical protein
MIYAGKLVNDSKVDTAEYWMSSIDGSGGANPTANLSAHKF